ncbi:aminotransferase class IV [Irregularibacter muris]|uniref:Aminotransferase class IV n=1 Tax=Irregularibacter muris TaxID=1796619 RepID=A0AAE3HCE6_9FIRM|nr:aminotransferase class IV [Irregularibacter muris]MCR1897747.1 aminotransferase class IV [Irregularibacter muris]
MKKEAVLDYFIWNSELVSTEKMSIFDEISPQSVYEVMKVVEGIPLFFGEHMDRMHKSLKALGIKLSKSKDEILYEITRLVEKNNCRSINVKLVYDKGKSGKPHFLTYFIKGEFPQESAYNEGVHTILFHGERETPNIKTLGGSFKEQVQKAREREGAYEALLTDKEGNIAEGSRSNVFFIKEDGLYTPPGKNVLLGVTRTHVMRLCEQLGIMVKEELINKSELEHLLGAFITGTTVDVLPVGSIDDIQLSTMENQQMKTLIKAYNEEMKRDIQKTKVILQEKNFL